ncbi:MAG: peptidyl-prolyl cis-trans isomerase, partial [Candidatus Eisenbacteria bacterium]
DLKSVEQQAWHTVVDSRLLLQEAKKAGLTVTDNEVLNAMRTNPPRSVLLDGNFQTNGTFDPQKYQQMTLNPNYPWGIHEKFARDELLVRKLQERLLSSLKLSQGELEQAFHDRAQRLAATVVQVPPSDTGSSSGSDAELQMVYDKYKSRMATTARTQLEYLAVPKNFGASEVKDALDMASGLVERARRGEDFAQLAKDYSEGPNSNRGGVIDRAFTPSELGPVIGQSVAAHAPGDVLDPYQENGRVMVFKVLNPAVDTTARNLQPGQVKLAQIVVKVRPATEAVQKQFEEIKLLRNRAKSVGLAKAATEKGMSTQKTPYFDAAQPPPQLFATPEAGDWALVHKKGEVSPVFEGDDQFLLAQVAAQHVAGAPTRAEVSEQLKQVADLEKRIELAKPKADRIAAAVQGGAALEAAAQSVQLLAFPTQMTRKQPDPRIAGAPEFQGALWGAKPGQVIGPIRTTGGWFFGRVEAVQAAPDSLYNDAVKGQLTTEILTARQRTFFEGYIMRLRAGADIADVRHPAN